MRKMKKKITILFSAVLIGMATSPTIPVFAEENLTLGDVNGDGENTLSTMELKEVGGLQYYLYTPSNPTNNMPLIVYLHGGTNKKEDVSALLTTDGFPKYLYEGYYGDLRAYVAIPKLDNSYKGWSNVSDQIKDMIKSLNANCGVDMNKISLTGHSMGGTGTYQLQVKLSNTFACIAPMSGSIQNNQENITALSKTKIWAFVGTEDTIVSPDSSRTIIKALDENGANARITELEGATHFDVPSLAYKNNELIQWLVNCGEENLTLGDANGDGDITAEDALGILKHVVGIEQPVFDADMADCDGDSEITANDALRVLEYVVGINK